MANGGRRFPLILVREFERRKTLRTGPDLQQKVALNTRLLQGAFYGHLRNEIIPALELGAHPDARDQNNLTALMHATIGMFEKAVSTLLVSRANPLIETTAVLRECQIVRINDGFEPQPGDIPVTAPVYAIKSVATEIVFPYIARGVCIPEEWHPAFINLAARTDELNPRNESRPRMAREVRRLLEQKK